MALLKAGPAGRIAIVAANAQGTGHIRNGLGLNAPTRQLRLHGCTVTAPAIDPQIEVGWLVAPGSQVSQICGSQERLPQLNQPIRQTVRDREEIGLKGGAQRRPQNRINQLGRPPQLIGLCQPYRTINRNRRGDTIEKMQLVQTQMQQPPHIRLGNRGMGILRQHGI